MCVRERDRQTETDRQTDRQTDRDTEKDRVVLIFIIMNVSALSSFEDSRV